MTVIFIDTSVFCNLIPVPGRAQDEAHVRGELKTRLERGDQFILPITAVIETGNFIAQLHDGGQRRATASTFEAILRLVCNDQAPWILHDVSWNRPFLERFLDGAETGQAYVGHAQNKVGAGDLCILTERAEYVQRTRVRTEIWTLDGALGAHN